VKNDIYYLRFVKECIDDIYSFTSGGEEFFFYDKKTQFAVIRALQVLAESTQRLSSEIKTTYPEVDWRGIGGFRNVLVHDYFGLNPARIWEIVETDLPTLEKLIIRMIEADSL